ncbi:hypothetical protein [Litoreibacter halocynthiae]
MGKRLLNTTLKHCRKQGVSSVWLATKPRTLQQ